MPDKVKDAIRIWMIRGFSTRRIAREIGITLPQIHAMFNCVQGIDCTGKGCRINARTQKR